MKLQSVKCPECGSPVYINEDQRIVYCSHCGIQITVDDGIHREEYTYNKVDVARIKEAEIRRELEVNKQRIEERDKRYERIKGTIGLILVIIFLIADGIFIYYCCQYLLEDEAKEQVMEEQYRAEGRIKVGISSHNLIGQNYETVAKQLREAGFTNIVTIDLNDVLVISKKHNTVESISIAGESSFHSDDFFFPDDKIIITYH